MHAFLKAKKELQTFGFDDNILDPLNRLMTLNIYHTHVKAQDQLVEMGIEILPVMETLLTSKSDILRKEAAKIIKSIADHSAVPTAIRMLEDSLWEVRWIGAETLIRIGRRSIKPLLKAIIENDKSFYLREGTHHVLSELIRDNDPDDLKKLQHVLLNGEYHETVPVITTRVLKLFSDLPD